MSNYAIYHEYSATHTVMPGQNTENTDTTELLQQLLSQPQKVEVDGKQVWNHELDHVVELDEYIQKKRAMKNRGCGIRFTKLEAGGAVR